jgi:dihydrofolate synthase/folylpolyglutamate synthase
MPEIKTYDDVLRYFSKLEMMGSHLGLERIQKILKKLGNPEQKPKTIHIAGTNGKGSVAAMLASILHHAGHKTGLYTSPHLIDFRERIVVNRKKIPKKDVVRITNLIKSRGVELTYFEFTTALAFQYFNEQSIDFLVLEVGLGGRLDATNVIAPLLSIITNISLEHTNYLGESIKEIAKEKAGIIKEGRCVITSCSGRAFKIIKETARRKNSTVMKPEKLKKTASNLKSQTFTYNNTEINLPLLGDFQLENTAIVLKAVEYLNSLGFHIPTENIKAGLESVKWPGRLEIPSEKPLLILDGAHNPAGISVLADFIKILQYNKMILLFNVMNDKDYRKMADALVPMADKIILTKAKIDRAQEPETIYKHIKKFRKDVLIEKNIKKSLELAFSSAENDDLILVTGSLYLVGNVKEVMNK